MRDGRDDVFDSGGGPQKTVTVVTDRHGKFGGESRERLFKGSSLVLEERKASFDGRRLSKVLLRYFRRK